VKIAPAYSGPTVHVLDASQAIGVVGALLGDGQADFVEGTRADQQRLRTLHHGRRAKQLRSYDEAVANRLVLDWEPEDVPAPSFLGRRPVRVPTETLVPYIDWTFFFAAWELKGKFPRILDDPEKGEAARELFANAEALLADVGDRLDPNGVYGFWPAASAGDDVVLHADQARREPVATLHFLRQQTEQPDDRPNLCLADFVAPPDGIDDHVGAFAVTVLGADDLADRFEAEGDDYRRIMVKALADRLAEALAEWLHEQAREDWGYEPAGRWTKEELHAERFRGIRPAFGYPACPDHSEKRTLMALLGAERAGIDVTESFAMTPAASVSGLYLGHPQARYFSVGRIGRDQVADYAERKGIAIAEAERWLRQNLAYEP
jgi:5-methyltetrahydrofolate--homocysteine methyltransferase